MLVIRLFRTGKKNQASYKIVVTDKQNAAAKGRFVEDVGFYNPITKERKLKADRIQYWMSVGAKPSDTVHNMLVSEKIIEGPKIPKHKKAKKKEEVEKTPALPETPVATETKEVPKTDTEESEKKEIVEKAPSVETSSVEESKPKEEKPVEQA